MPISFQCPECAKPFNLGDELAGKKARCGCGLVMLVPQPAAPLQQPVQQQPLAPQQPLDPLMAPSQQPLAPQQPLDPLMGSLPPAQQGVAPQQPFNPMAAVQQPTAAAGGGGKGAKIAIMVGASVGGVAVVGLLAWLVISSISNTGPDTHDRVFDDWMAASQELADAVNEINTVEDVETFKGEIERLNVKMAAINERAKVLGKPDRETQQQLRFKLGKSSDKILTGMMLKMGELYEDPEIKAALDEAMAQVQPMEPPIDLIE
jgi:hypothetical protein